MKRDVQKLVRQVQANLTDELRKPKYRGHPNPMAGHCYVASEALYHLLGGKSGGWRPMHVRHEGEPHWFLVNDKCDVVDATATQFATPVPVHLARGKGFLTKQPSKRAQAVMKRVRRSAKPNPRVVPIDRDKLFVRVCREPELDLERGYSYSMGAFGDETEAHAGLSGYAAATYGGIEEALMVLHERMGICGRFVDNAGRPVPMYVAVYEGDDVGVGPDNEDLFRPERLILKARTDAAKDADQQVENIVAFLDENLVETAEPLPNPRPVPIDRSRIYSIADALTDKILASLKSGGDTDDPYPSGVLAVLEDVDLPVVPTAGPIDVEFEEDWSPPARPRTPKRRTPYSTVKADVWAIGAPNESTRWKLTGHFSASAPDDYPKGYMPFALDVSIKLPGKVEKKHWIDNPQALRDEVRRVLLHEVTHFARAPWMKRYRSATFPKLDTQEKICAYYNEPEEVEARAQEIAAQCITTARQMRRYAKLSMQALLGMSDTYNTIAWCLTDKNHRIIVQKVYRALDEEGLAPTRGKESVVRKRNPTYEARLRKEYGVTDDPMLGGFLLPDGSFLDFSEGSGQRIQDHRNIKWASTVAEKPHESRYDVMSRVAKKVGMYRWMPENWSLETWTLPTPQQARMIESLAYDAPGSIIEIEAHRGKADYHHEYESWQAEDIVDDLKAFYGGRKPRRRNPAGDADASSNEAEALRVVLAMAKVRKFKPSLKTPEAKQLVSAYFEAKGWRPDRYGNLLHPTKKDERIQFSKQRVQRQAKIQGTWKNIRTYSPVDAARKLVVEAAKLENDAETLAAWTKGAQAKMRQKKTAVKRREKQSLRKKAAVAAMKQLAAENPRLVAVAGYGILLEKEDLDRMISRRDELVEAFMRDVEAGRELPGDGQFASVDKPPTAPLGYDVSYLWTETVDGVQYTVSVRYANKGVAIVTIGSSSELGLIVDPRTHAMKPADYKPEGDAQISGQVMFNGDTFMGSLFLISAKQRRTGAGGRVLGLWCRMMKGYGIEAWRAEAVGPEGLAFLQAMQNRGCVEILGGQRSDLVVQCLNCGRKDNPVKKEEELPEGQYEIPSNKIQELERRIARFERKTKKLKLSDPISAEIVGEKVRPVFDELGEKTGRVRVYKIVQIVGTAPRVGDHTFIARVQHTEAGNIVDRAPDTENVKLPKSLWAADATCDHCRLIRSRNETFVLRNDKTGKLIRVGRSCLADYLRSDDAAAALSLWSLMDDLRKMSRDIDEDGEGGYGSGRQFQEMVDYLARVVRAIEEQGWVSASRAREEGGTSTAGLADWSTFPLSARADREDAKLHAALQPTPQAVAQAQKALAWARNLKPTSDYERNLQVVANLDYVPPKSAALAASMVAGYLRNQAKLVEKQRAKKRAAEKVNEHFGEEGAQYCRALTVLRRIDIEGFYGTTRLYVMEDNEGRSFKWFASKLAYHPRYDWDNPNADANMEADDREERSLMPGDRLWFAFTIKKHDVWHNKKTDVREKQTIITRAAVHEDGCKSKWMDPETGQIFKTKKAMVAAQAKQNPTWRTPEVDAAIEQFVETLPPGQWVHVRVELRPGRKPFVVKVADLDGLADVMRVRRAGGIAVHKPKPFGKNNPTIKDARGRVLYVVPEPIENYL